jgi:hypothetical protein
MVLIAVPICLRLLLSSYCRCNNAKCSVIGVDASKAQFHAQLAECRWYLKGSEGVNPRLKILLFRTQFRGEYPKLLRGDVWRLLYPNIG